MMAQDPPAAVVQTPVRLTWKALGVSVQRGGNDLRILDGVTGFAEPGRLLAIMGPSGSGKTTLLETLAGRLSQNNSNAIQTGEIRVNGREEKLAFGSAAAYVTQHDTLIATLTVFETMMYSAYLRFPDKMAKTEKLARVKRAISEMGLQDREDTRVGGWISKGLSGGEKRRLSIALEILTRPKVLFLDEPTSGLDSAAAYFVLRTIRNLATDGHTLLAVVHQPSSEVFELFHDLLLLSNGRTVYFGGAEGATQFFEDAGYPCPILRNPSDHYIRCINKDFDAVRTAMIRTDRDRTVSDEELGEDIEAAPDLLDKFTIEAVVKTLIEAYEKSDEAKETAEVVDMKPSKIDKDAIAAEWSSDCSKSSFLMQVRVLTQRSFVNMWRDWSYYWVRLGMYIALALFIGWTFFRVGFVYQSIQGRASCVSFVVGFLTFMSIGGFPSFVEEMKVFAKERQNGHYAVIPFIIANTLSSLPFLVIIALCSSAISYCMAQLHPGFTHFLFYSLIVFTSLVVVEGLMMAVASVVPNFLMGIIVGASIMGVLLLLSGFYQLPNEIPDAISKYPLFYMNFFMYALQGMFKNEFDGLTFSGIEPQDAPLSGSYIIRKFYQIDVSRSKWEDLAILWGMAFGYRAVFFVFIKGKELLGVRNRYRCSQTRKYIKQTLIVPLISYRSPSRSP